MRQVMTFKCFNALRGIIRFLRVRDIVWCTNRINLSGFLAVDFNTVKRGICD
jgi:hypothetical protein